MPLDLTNRSSLMASLPKWGIGAEIGVAEGCFSRVLLEVCKPSLLYLIDSWIYQTKEALKEDASNVSEERHTARYKEVQERYNDNPGVRILRLDSLQAAKRFADEYFDWWHLDGDHTQAAEDIAAWWPKLRPGGWATGHDYTMAGVHIMVKEDIDRFVAENGLELFVSRGDNDIYEKNYPTWAIRKL